jgi:DNA-binding NarL/FixJ family response regulator
MLGRFDALIGRGLEEVLRADGGLRIVGIDLDGPELERAIARRAPRVVVLAEANVMEPSSLQRLQAANSGTGLVVVAYRPSRAYGARLLRSGVAACLSVEASERDILGAISLAAAGKQVLASVPDGSIQAAHHRGVASLTSREREVLGLLSLGESNAEIAQRLHISTETVRTHVRHIMGKLGVSKRRRLVGFDLIQDHLNRS